MMTTLFKIKVFNYSLRLNLAIAIVKMANNTVSESKQNHKQANKYETNNYEIDKQTNMKQKTNKLKQTDKNLQVTIAGHTKTLNWDKEETNYLLSAFFYGYVVMQVQK